MCCSRLTRFLLTANVEQYFLWNGVMYVTLGVLVWLWITDVRQFMCTIPAEGIGCGNCSSLPLMCGKDQCWQMAVNMTYQVNSKLPDDTYYKARVEAALDTNCNNLIATRTSPIDMMEGILSRRARTNGQKPSSACVTFHCKVLLNSVLRSSSTEIAGTRGDKCTNELMMKPPDKATECPCTGQVEVLTMELAAQFRDLCGSMASQLTSAEMYVQNLKKSKDLCYSTNILSSLPVLLSNRNCTYLMQSSFTAFEWFELKETEESLYTSGQTSTRFSVPSDCTLDMCKAFNNTLHSRECHWSTDRLLLSMTAEDATRVANNCPSFGFSAQTICNIVGHGSTLPNLCSAATARRLDAKELPGAPVNVSGPAGAARPCQGGGGPAGGGCRGRGRRGAAAGTSRVLGAADHNVAASSGRGRLLLPPPAPAAGTRGVGSSAAGAAAAGAGAVPAGEAAALERRLQQTPAPAPAPATDNSKLANWVTGPWSKCTCLQPCLGGVRSRSVTCPAGMQCKEPKEPEAKPCNCGHCADCYAVTIGQGAACIYWAQGGCCLILCMVFYSVANLTEDDLSDMRCGTRLLGCLCKALPVLIRASVYVNLAIIVSIFVQVLPDTGFAKDCSSSDSLTVLTISASASWVGQLTIGVCMHRRRQMPPWLHNSVKAGWAKMLMCPLRAIGP